MTKLFAIHEYGQSVWLNYLRRAFIESGELRDILEAGVTGITSTPMIFEKAITDSSDYDKQLLDLVSQGLPVMETYQALVVDDIQRTADLLMPIFELTHGKDGFVSLELNPALAHEQVRTVAEARHVLARVNRPNVMIEIPATQAGIAAIETLTHDGVNVNATHIFSLATYDLVAEAYIKGMAGFIETHSVWRQTPASVASVSLNRIDEIVDARLLLLGRRDLLGKAAIALAKSIYVRFCERFSGPEWQNLEKKGAKVQNPKWTRTTPRDFRYRDTYYVEELIGPDTICTVSPSTLNAFRDHGQAASSLTQGIELAKMVTASLNDEGIDLEMIGADLQRCSLADFDNYFRALVRSVSEKRGQLERSWRRVTVHPGSYRSAMEQALEQFCDDRVMCRIWSHDHTVWRNEPHEIVNRLGWLHIIDSMQANLDRLSTFAEAVLKDGFENVIVIGMGGSSLAPELFAQVFEPWVRLHHTESPLLPVTILDTTDPDVIRSLVARQKLKNTLFIVASKSGTTVETLSAFNYFYNRLQEQVEVKPGQNFVAITDPGTPLVDLAERLEFREIFLNDPTIGGRYAALSYFGLVPAALAGVDLPLLLDRGLGIAVNAHSCNCPLKGDNLAAQLGTFMGTMAHEGRDKLTLITSPAIEPYGKWVEQLVAESTGKEDIGILPVVGEMIGLPSVYGNDRFFVYMRLETDDSQDGFARALVDAGQPVMTIQLRDLYDLGGQFFAWELGTTIACHFLGINPFDQPDVESAKRLARQLMASSVSGKRTAAEDFSEMTASNLGTFLQTCRPGNYIAIQAYTWPTSDVQAVLGDLQTLLRDRYRLATTVGFGPRYLHSTGQYHKGGPKDGFFVQILAPSSSDLSIPDEPGNPAAQATFGMLRRAQALGDARALLDARQRVIRFQLSGSPEDCLKRWLDEIESWKAEDVLQPA